MGGRIQRCTIDKHALQRCAAGSHALQRCEEILPSEAIVATCRWSNVNWQVIFGFGDCGIIQTLSGWGCLSYSPISTMVPDEPRFQVRDPNCGLGQGGKVIVPCGGVDVEMDCPGSHIYCTGLLFASGACLRWYWVPGVGVVGKYTWAIDLIGQGQAGVYQQHWNRAYSPCCRPAGGWGEYEERDWADFLGYQAPIYDSDLSYDRCYIAGEVGWVEFTIKLTDVTEKPDVVTWAMFEAAAKEATARAFIADGLVTGWVRYNGYATGGDPHFGSATISWGGGVDGGLQKHAYLNQWAGPSTPVFARLDGVKNAHPNFGTCTVEQRQDECTFCAWSETDPNYFHQEDVDVFSFSVALQSGV